MRVPTETNRRTLCAWMMMIAAVIGVSTADCKQVKDYNFRPLAANYTSSTSQNPFTLTLKPFQKEQSQVVYTDGSKDPWKDTGKNSETVVLSMVNKNAPYSEDICLPGFQGTEDSWPDKNVTASVALTQ